MTTNPLAAIRERLRLTQAQMAQQLEISVRAYQEQEASDTPRRAYILAARHLSEGDGRRLRSQVVNANRGTALAPIAGDQPSPRDAELRELLDFPNETLSAEYKSSLDLSQERNRAAMAKHLAALSNHGGGHLVFGFNDDMSVTIPNPYSDPPINRDTIAGVVKKYLEPPFQCDVRLVRSSAGNDHPIIVVPPHGSTPVCAKAGGPEERGRPVGITKGTYYIRKPGPSSEAITAPAEWQALFGRCMLHSRAGVISAVSAALGRHPDEPPQIDPIVPWHAAAEAAFLAKLGDTDRGIDLRKYRIQFSYVFNLDKSMRIQSGRLERMLCEVNAELRQFIQSGWSMFHIFGRDGLSPYWNSDPASGEGDEDFLECSLMEQDLDFGGADFWRVAPTGKATLIREFWEDHPRLCQHHQIQQGSVISPDLLGRTIAEFVHHARGFAERFDTAAEVSFRCEWLGLAGRQPFDLEGFHFRYGRRATVDHRVSTGTWAVGDLTSGLEGVVAKLAEPIARSFGLEDQLSATVIKGRADRWRRL